ncbi:MAG: DUF1572 domain-containing protein ['Candidatus Kapabacteria' thiocyanatum]|uniref:DUF1572 domain-containing protein n=1 Tax=Candidatus Kapaibacterium thiocyanatum TaxID=1895771 RepID=A0A1M3KZ70_9BACT|nr:DUF1572 domain-containing protein ['Candidatus Kapabacteria' thiocyanatum]OJX57808.1 MAG: DUF1572 domain-containing protein ['Candidatus Kapabacteria' thiocyanatum]
MTLTRHIAKHFREIHFGGNWTCSNMKDQLADVTWEQAITKVHTFNTIATLAYHANYYVDAVLKVVRGGPLDADDNYSFDHPPITSQEDWQRLLDKSWRDAENLAAWIETMPEHMLWENIADEKYGIYFRNIHGIIEHTHYHLGQIALIKKLLPNIDAH